MEELVKLPEFSYLVESAEMAQSAIFTRFIDILFILV